MNRKLNSYIYNGWRLKDALKNVLENKDVVVRKEERMMRDDNLLNTTTKPYYYIYSFDGGYKVKLSEKEAMFYEGMGGNIIDY